MRLYEKYLVTEIKAVKMDSSEKALLDKAFKSKYEGGMGATFDYELEAEGEDGRLIVSIGKTADGKWGVGSDVTDNGTTKKIALKGVNLATAIKKVQTHLSRL